jgi:valyl-tRNA synthetase
MASTSEVGHAKNVANYTTLYQILEEMDTLYAPSNPNLRLVNLQPIKTTLATTIQSLNNTSPIYKNAVAKRENAIEPLGKTVSSVLNSFKSLNVSPSKNLQTNQTSVKRK